MSAAGIIILLITAAAGAPLFVVIGGMALFLFAMRSIDPSAVIIELYRMASAPTLTAIPLFTFAGYMLAESKTPQRLINLYNAWLGWLPGGLAIVSFIACAFFTAFTGASGVTIIALGGILLPALIKEGYSERFSLGLLTTGGSLGLLFPPSLPLILYGLIAHTNVDALFLAGIIPGSLLVVMLSLYSLKAGVRRRRSFVWAEAKSTLRESIWILPLPLIILGGIYGGIFTASEAAAVTALYVLILESLVYRDLNIWRDIPKIASDSMILVGGVLLILGCALGLTNYLIDEQIPMKLLAVIQQYIHTKFTFLIALNVFLLIVGCLMDIFSAIIVVVPLILPIAEQFGVNPIHLGIIFLANLEIGYATPPVGLNLFISSFRFKKPVTLLYNASLPFLLVLLFALMLITYVPHLSLWLVEVFGVK